MVSYPLRYAHSLARSFDREDRMLFTIFTNRSHRQVRYDHWGCCFSCDSWLLSSFFCRHFLFDVVFPFVGLVWIRFSLLFFLLVKQQSQCSYLVRVRSSSELDRGRVPLLLHDVAFFAPNSCCKTIPKSSYDVIRMAVKVLSRVVFV